MIEQLTGFSPGVLAFACSGRVTGEDYRRILEPAVEAAAKDHPKLRLYYRIEPDFTGVDAGAMWEDAKVGLAHLTRWERIAVVTDIEWIAHAIQAFGFLMPGQVRTFTLGEADPARTWVEARPAE